MRDALLILEVVRKEVGEDIDKMLADLIDTMIVDITGGVSNSCDNLFGEPITNETVNKLVPALRGKFTYLDRARLALAVKNSKGRFDAKEANGEWCVHTLPCIQC